MLQVETVSDVVIDYNGYSFLLGTVSAGKLKSFPATFAERLNVKPGDYLDEVEMSLTTAKVGDDFQKVVRIERAVIREEGKLSPYIDLPLFGIIVKPKGLAEVPRVGLDARPQLRFTVRVRDAYGAFIAWPAYATKIADQLLADDNHISGNLEVTIMPDRAHGHTLFVRAFKKG